MIKLLVACIIIVQIVMVIELLVVALGFIDQNFDLDFNLSGTIGHVAHGKSTVVKAISGVQVILLIFNE